MIDRRTMLLVAASTVLAGIIAIEIRADAGAGDDTISTSPAAAAATAQLSEEATVIQRRQRVALDPLVSTTLARPLFSSSRRPPQITREKRPITSDLSGMRLAGIVVAPERRIAIFAVTGGKPLVLAEGQNMGSWRIETILPRQVSLSSESGPRTLEPKSDSTLDHQSKRRPSRPQRGAHTSPIPGAPGPQSAVGASPGATGGVVHRRPSGMGQHR
jgi:hypothetical protein